MPAVFAHTRSADLAKAHFNFVGDDGGKDQILAAQTLAFTKGKRRGDEIAGMTRIRFPINIVVIHSADHVAIQKCSIDRVRFESRDEGGGAAVASALATRHGAVMLQQNLRVILLTAAKRAANGIKPK